MLKHTNDTLGVSASFDGLTVHDRSATPAPAPFDCVLEIDASRRSEHRAEASSSSSAASVALQMFRGVDGTRELHVRVTRPRLRACVPVVFAMCEPLLGLARRAAVELPRFVTHHFGAERRRAANERVVIVRLEQWRCALLARRDAAAHDDACLVLAAESAAVQSKQLPASNGTRATLIGSCEDIQIVRWPLEQLRGENAPPSLDMSAAVAIAQPFDLLADVVLSESGVSFATPGALLKPAPVEEWPRRRTTVSGNVALQKSRRSSEATRDTVVFAVSSRDLLTLLDVGAAVRNAALASAVPTLGAADATAKASSSTRLVRLRHTRQVSLDVTSRDDVCVKLVTETDEAQTRDNSKRLSASCVAIGKLSIAGLFAHWTGTWDAPAQLLGADAALDYADVAQQVRASVRIGLQLNKKRAHKHAAGQCAARLAATTHERRFTVAHFVAESLQSQRVPLGVRPRTVALSAQGKSSVVVPA